MVEKTLHQGESGPFGLLDRDLVRYFIDFHIAADYIQREEPIPDEIVEFLVEKRREKLAQTRYLDDKDISGKNLEFIVRQIGNENARGHGRFKEVLFESELVASHEHNPMTPISKIQKRVKVLESYWMKSMINVAKQNETGHYDHLALRIFVECEEARLFRMFRERDKMDRPDRDKYHALFGPKQVAKLDVLEKEQYLAQFKWEYSDLSVAEKKIYQQRWSDKHRQMCLELAEKIADSVSWNTVPVRPHYGNWQGIPMRAQTQNIFSRDAQKIASVDYLLFEDEAASKSFMDQFHRGSASLGAKSYSLDGSLRRISDRLLVRFSLAQEDIDGLEQDLYLAIAKRDIALKPRRADGKYKDNSYLADIRLGLPDVPGFFIYAETTTVDLEDKYPGFVIDRTKSREMFVKSYIGQSRKANDYETASVFISLDEAKQIAFEVQVRDYIMHEKATCGSAAHEAYKEEKTKDLSADQLIFGEAFFGEGTEGDVAFDTWYFSYLSGKLTATMQEIIIKDSPSESPEILNLQFGKISALYEKAVLGLSAERSAALTLQIDGMREAYIKSKKSRAIESRDQIARIDAGLRQMNDVYGASFTIAENDAALTAQTHRHHLNLLFNAFSIYAHSDDVVGLATSFYIGALIKDYTKAYAGNELDRKTLRDFHQKVNALYADIVKTERWQKSKSSPIGYAPGAIPKNYAFAKIKVEEIAQRIERDEPRTDLSGITSQITRLARRMENLHESTRAYLQNQIRN